MSTENKSGAENKAAIEGGWKYDYDFLQKLASDINIRNKDNHLSMEDVEDVLLAINYSPSNVQGITKEGFTNEFLTPIGQQTEQKLTLGEFLKSNPEALQQALEIWDDCSGVFIKGRRATRQQYFSEKFGLTIN